MTLTTGCHLRRAVIPTKREHYAGVPPVRRKTPNQVRQSGLKGHHLSGKGNALETLKILRKMRQTNKPYNEALHMRNQVLHGSWVIALTQQAPVAVADA